MKKFSILNFSLLVVVVAFCVSCGQLFSSLFVGYGFLSTSSVFVDGQTFFAISTNKFDTLGEAEKFSADEQKNSNAGFVYEFDNHFYILSSAYENKADAEKVLNTIQSKSAEIIKIELPRQKFEGEFTSQEKEILSTCLKEDFQIFKLLYNIAISLDTKVTNDSEAKIECNEIYSTHIKNQANFETISSQKDLDLNSIKTDLEKNGEILNELISEKTENTDQTLSSLIKFTYLKILLK